ncbi:hypothetical protein [Streptomyces violaceus]|uniref:Uncharacterized protein n=1 Tax=Streptomyces violaceus TaxID=1936 RepID=A0ABY9U7X6_STRVL|nr:hypothetical protein [Streptomyces janthinus]WND18974.1 hypothetical protein RI060_17195 [Streptomyces janthinus]GGS88893.1 hypothetical protein GCM10010270_71290 [Streptomyces janthinus]
MGGRPRDWSPLCWFDPVPGDPDRLASLGKKLKKTAEELERQVKNLKAISEIDSWDSDAGREFRKRAEGSTGKLEAARKRYAAAATALGDKVVDVGGSYADKVHASATDYASDLNRAQQIADQALKEAQSADDERRTAGTKLSDAEDDAKKKELEDQQKAADDVVKAAQEKIEEAKRIRDAAARRACDAIDEVISDDALKDGFWDSLLDDIANITGLIATVCGVLSLMVGWIPVIGQALAGILGTIALVMSLVGFICTAVLYMRGNADLMDLGEAALGFLMIGVGKAFSKLAGKYAGTALRRLTRMKSSKTPGIGKAFKRDRQKLNRLGSQGVARVFSMTPKELGKTMASPFTELVTKSGWKGFADNAKTVFNMHSWRGAKEAISANGGVAKSVSLVDAEVAASLKSIKPIAANFPDIPGVNGVKTTVNVLTGIGYAVTGGNIYLDENTRPAL